MKKSAPSKQLAANALETYSTRQLAGTNDSECSFLESSFMALGFEASESIAHAAAKYILEGRELMPPTEFSPGESAQGSQQTNGKEEVDPVKAIISSWTKVAPGHAAVKVS